MTGLTDDEHAAVEALAQAWNALVRVVPAGPTQTADLGELAAHVHALQNAVLAQAAARAHPTLYRLMGQSLRA